MDHQFLDSSPVTKLAYVIACMAHTNQTDKAGEPYIRHPLAVAAQMLDETTIAAALLHDVLEDTPRTACELLELGMPPSVVDVVVTLTRKPDEPYFDYIARVGTDPRARKVKLADLRHNSDPARLKELDQAEADSLRARYLRAIAMLEEQPPKPTEGKCQR